MKKYRYCFLLLLGLVLVVLIASLLFIPGRLDEETETQTESVTLPEETGEDICRILLTGESEAPDLSALERALAPRFYGLTLVDRTRLPRDLWHRRGEDNLTGLFLEEMWQLCQKDPEDPVSQLAARFGLAALENGEDAAL